MRNGSKDMRQFLPKARNLVCLLFFRGPGSHAYIVSLICTRGALLEVSVVGIGGQFGESSLGNQLLGESVGASESDECIWHATCWASDYLLERHQVLRAYFPQRRLFKKFSGFPFGNNGGVFCSFCRLISILAMTGTEDQRLRRLQGCYWILLAGSMVLDYLGEAMPAGRFSSAFTDVVLRQALIGHKT